MKKGLSPFAQALLAIAVALALSILLLALIYDPRTALAAAEGLFSGVFGSVTGVSDALSKMIPYALAGAAVSVGFRCGLFNVGVEGQILIGSLCSALVGYQLTLPAVVHLPLSFLAGVAGGALWALIPALLKVKTGAHEVINTIMMNFLAINLIDFLVNRVLKDPAASAPQTPLIAESARIPILIPESRLSYGLLVMLLLLFLLWLFLRKSRLGFEIKVTGINPDAARYAGIAPARTILLSMSLSGSLAGAAGALLIQGVSYQLPASFAGGYGFDAIAVALLAGKGVLAIIPSAFLWGALRSGAASMQLASSVSSDMIGVVQGLIVIFVAAPALISSWFVFGRLRKRPNTGPLKPREGRS